MKKGIIALSAVAALATTSFANSNSDMAAQLEMLKKQIAVLEAKLNSNTESLSKVVKKVKKNDKKIKKVSKKANHAKMLANNDNLKWNVDFRTSVDKISYDMADGTKQSNDSLYTNRLWMNMAYAPTENMAFYGRLSYLKAYGAEAQNTQRSTGASNNFDWVANENALGDNSLNVKQAYWLYKNDTFLGKDISWTASVGRRPSTDGLLANYREDQDRQSALAHTVNVEFDGASFRWNLDQVIPMEGTWFKLCMGRGITNAHPRFDALGGSAYANDSTQHADSNMIGMIYVPYDNGQYSVHTNYAKATHMIGYRTDQAGGYQDFGGMSWATIAFVADGIGSEISDRLDNTKFFISFAQSKTDPNSGVNGQYMLGDKDSKTGHSTWIGIQTPCFLSEDGKIGIEWNKGSRYWRSMTHAEDTMIGSKVAARGTAWEVYYNKPLTKTLSMSVRYTKIDYDYSGSNGFFGAAGAPTKITSDMANGSTTISKAEDIRAYIRYRY